MQKFTLNVGKTKAELLALTEKINLGDVTYDPRIKGIYENEWHSIEPSAVIKPEINGEEQDYYYKTTKLTKNNKYCAKLYWKAGAIMQEGNTSDMFSLYTNYSYLSELKYIPGGQFNIESGIVDTIFYNAGMGTSGKMYSKGFAISEEMASILDTTEIRETLKKIPGIAKCEPALDMTYVYSGTKTNNTLDKPNNVIFASNSNISTYPPISNIFGHIVTYDRNNTPLFKITDGTNDDENIVLSYSQPESNADNQNFYKMGSDSTSYSAIYTYFPQGLPIGVPILVAPAFISSNTSYSSNKSTMVAPFIFYMLGITEVPEE